MRRIALVVVFLGALAVAGITFMPASLVDARVAAMTSGKLRLVGASGTLWHGQGALADAAGTWRTPLAWRIDPLDLARGLYRVTLLPPGSGAAPRGAIALRDGSIAASDVALDVPAAALASLFPARTAPTLGGTIAATSPALGFERGGPTGSLDARWMGARVVTGAAVADLGTVHLAVRPQGNGLAGTLTSDGGNVRLEGTLTYAAPALGIDATLTPGPEAPEAVRRVLAMAGTADASGRVRLAWRGNVQ